jgi:hypothetical protein
MGELRVPTVAFPAEAVCCDGRTFLGRIFVPAAASRHAGAMRAEEWMNDATAFFPFLPDDARASILLNKDELLLLSVAAAADEGDVEDGAAVPVRRVAVECGSRRLEGVLVIEMPSTQSRVTWCASRASPGWSSCPRPERVPRQAPASCREGRGA